MAGRTWILCLSLAFLGCQKPTADLVEEARSEDPLKRLHAIHALAERGGDESAMPMLLSALKDANTHIRRDAAKALGQMGAKPEAVAGLQSLLKDKEPSVRKAAKMSLQMIGAPAVEKKRG